MPGSTPGCDQPSDGRAWTSTDGVHWSESAADTLVGIPLWDIVDAGGTLYAFGARKLPDCTHEPAVLRSLDGREWQLLDTDLGAGSQIDAVAVAGDRLVALGWHETPDDFGDDAWTSIDGSTWLRARDEPRPFFEGWDDVEAKGDLVVAVSSGSPAPVWYSADAGQTWREADVGGTYTMSRIGVAASDDLVVVTTSACCGLPDESAGVSLATNDGTTWQSSEPKQDAPVGIIGIPGGFVALGARTWIAADGIDWSLGPRFATDDVDHELTAAGGPQGVVVISSGQAWFAPMSDVVASDPPKTPIVADMPETGVRYRTDLYLHCGFRPIGFGLRAWVPDPPFEDPVNVPPGFREHESGWLTQVAPNRLLFESRRGKSLDLRPSEERGYSFPCA